MYSFLTRKGWLSKEHLDSPYLTNVLRGGDKQFDPFFLKKAEAAQRLIDAEKNGKVFAGLHLSAKMEDIFGELTEEDFVKHFGGKALATGKWTLAFKFKSMRDMDPMRTVSDRGKKRKRTAKSEWEKYLKRGCDISNIKERLSKILRFSSEIRRQASGRMLDEVEKNDHVLAEKSFAFRKTLEGDTPNFESSSKYFEDLQHVLQTTGNITENDHFYEGPGPFVPKVNFSSIHFDVTEWTRNSPSISLKDAGIGNAIYDKFIRDLRKYVRSEKYRGLLDVHFHSDVDAFMPSQRRRRPDLAIDDLVLLASEGADDIAAIESEQKAQVDFDTPLEGKWCHFYSDSGNRVFLSMLHVLMGGKAMSDLLKAEKDTDSDTATVSNIFLHGVAIAITQRAREAPLAQLKFSRLDSAILVSHADRVDAKLIQATRFLEQAQTYPPSCCWTISQEGLQRFGGGDCQHAESQTRIIRSILTMTEPRFLQLQVEEERRNVLVVTKSKGVDGPIIASTFDQLRGTSIVYRIKDTTVLLEKLLRALDKARISAEHLVLLFAMGGCGTLPSTQHVRSASFVRAFLKYREVIGSLRDAEEGFDLRNYREDTWKTFEKLVATAYVEAVGKGGVHLRTEDVHGNEWTQTVRTLIAKLPKTVIAGPSGLMPPSEDIEVQTRKAFWLLRYWNQTDQFHCDDSSDGLCIKWGFTNDGDPFLEREEAVAARKKILKNIITTCRCKTGCRTGRCSCFKGPDSIPCLLCDCDNCENRGGITPEERAALSGSVKAFSQNDDPDDEDEAGDKEQYEESEDSDGDDSEANSILEILDQEDVMDVDALI